MRRHIPIFMMFVRSSLYRVLLILAGMVLAESFLFFLTIKEYLEVEARNPAGAYALNRLIQDSKIVWVFLVSFLLITLVLCLVGCDFNGKLEYTVQRLGISPIGIFFWQAGCNALMYVLFWLAQLYTVFGFCMYYLQAADPSWVTGQTLFLEFHRSGFLFTLLPLENIAGWLLNVVTVLCLGIVTARVPHCQRRKSRPIAIFVLIAWTIGTWPPTEMGGTLSIVAMVINSIVAGLSIFCVYLAEPGLKEE